MKFFIIQIYIDAIICPFHNYSVFALRRFYDVQAHMDKITLVRTWQDDKDYQKECSFFSYTTTEETGCPSNTPHLIFRNAKTCTSEKSHICKDSDVTTLMTYCPAGHWWDCIGDSNGFVVALSLMINHWISNTISLERYSRCYHRLVLSSSIMSVSEGCS
jgi:hypothetical protein